MILTKKNILDKNFNNFLNKSFFALIVKLLGILISTGVTIIISRSIGADGLGLINLTSKILSVLMLASLFGVNQIIVREVSKGMKLKNFDRVYSVVISATVLTLVISLILSLSLYLSANWLASEVFDNLNLKFVFEVFAMCLPLQVIARVYASTAIGMNKIWQGNMVNQTLSMFIVGLILFTFGILDKKITLQLIVYSYLIARAIQLLVFRIYWIKYLKPDYEKLVTDYGNIWKMSHPLLIASASVVLSESIATIFIGIYSNTYEIGLFSVASRLAIFTGVILQVTNSTLSPKIANMFETDDNHTLQTLIYKITILVTVLGLVFFFIFVFLGPLILSIWGKEFVNAYFILIILSMGQLFNLATGSCGVILVMTGLEKIRRNISLVSLALNLILCPILINFYSSIGAAFAISIIIIVENVTKVFYVHNKTSLRIFKKIF